MAESKTVMVTGATGFIASWLVKLLLEKGYTVHGTVRDPADKEKTKHLLELPNASDKLHLFKADLLEEGSYDEAIKGCGGVFHTASPFFMDKPTDPDKELLEPAVKGTLNVLKAAKATPTVKRVVLTSSTAAVTQDDTRTEDKQVDESYWSKEDYMRKNNMYYPLSKTLAEKAAWDFAKENNIDLVVINPAMVIGKMLQPGMNESSKILSKYVTGEVKKYPNGTMGWVHVEDVAAAHLLAYEKPEAEGRYLCVASWMHFKEICVWLKNIDPKLPAPTECADSEPKKTPLYFSNRKLLNLGLRFKNIETMLRDCLTDLREKGHVPATA